MKSIPLIVARLLSVALQASALILLGRAVTPAVYGIVATVTGMLAFYVVLVDFGLPPLLSRLASAQEYASVNAIVRINSLTTWSFGTGACIAVVVVALYTSQPLALGVLAVSTIVEKSCDTLLSIPIALGRIMMAGLNVLLRRAVSLLIFVALLMMTSFAQDTAVAIYSFALLGGAAVGMVHVAFEVHRRPGRFEARLAARKVLPSAMPYLLGNLSAQTRSLEVPLIAAVAGGGGAGLYAAGSRVSSSFSVISSAIASVALPDSVNQTATTRMRSALKLSALHCAASILFALSAPFVTGVVTFLFGEDYESAGPVLQVLLIAVPIVGLASVLGAILQGAGLARFVGANGVAFGIALVGTVVLGCLIQGPTGAAWAVFGTYLAKDCSLLFRLRAAGRITPSGVGGLPS